MFSKRKRTSIYIASILVSAVSIYFFTFSTYEEKENLSHQRLFNENYKVYSLNLPTELDFAGESVPLDLIDVKEKLDRELLVNTYWQSNGLLLIKRANRYFPIIEPILEEEGVPDDFKYLALIESGFTQIVSPAGATGIWQIMKSTGRELGLEINGEVDERYHIEKSTRAACTYLKIAYEIFGSWTRAAASYNMGMQGLSKQIERQKVINYYDLLLNAETGRYVFRILALKHIMQDPQRFGFNYRETDLYPPIATTTIVIDSSVNDFATWALEQGVNYKVLKTFNPWLRDNYLSNSIGKRYEIKIPVERYKKQLQIDLPSLRPDTLLIPQDSLNNSN
jgi:hypothetical protein